MNKKEKKAINILRDQKDKLADINYTPNQVWITETQSYVKDFFGENSREFKFIDEFRFTYIDIPHNIFLANKEKAKEYLSNCIDRIKHYGLYKPPKQNFIARMDQKALIAWLTAIAAAIFFLGKFTSDFQNSELKQTIKSQHDTIEIYKTRIEKLTADSTVKLVPKQ